MISKRNSRSSLSPSSWATLSFTLKTRLLSGPEMDMPTDLYAKDIGVWNFKKSAELTDAGRAPRQTANGSFIPLPKKESAIYGRSRSTATIPNN